METTHASWLRSLPLRGKLAITILGTVIAVLGTSTYFSFRYWADQSLATSEQQALLAASSIQTALESALTLGRTEIARRSLRELQERAPVTSARIYSADGTVVLSTVSGEAGTRSAAAWIPRPIELPREGLVRTSADEKTARAFLPLDVPGAAVLEVEFSVAAVRAAVERGGRLGIGLLIASVLVLALMVMTMFEREVVLPLHRVGGLLAGREDDAPRSRDPDELRQLEASVTRLIERERTADELVAERNRHLAAREGLAQVGEMAAEMAHEFKRPLASIRTAVDMLQQEYVLEEGGRQTLEGVEAQLERLTDTMSDLFSLARPVVLEKERLDTAEVVDDALVVLAGSAGTDRVEVVREYAGELPPVPGDRHRLEQAFLNVMVNAVEAMPGGGVLTVAIRGCDGEVEVTFQDTGPGMTPEEIEQAFRPFHSTKPVGTGLGLPLVARIVAAHQGRIDVESTPGEGTRVRILLPRRPGAEPGRED